MIGYDWMVWILTIFLRVGMISAKSDSLSSSSPFPIVQKTFLDGLKRLWLNSQTSEQTVMTEILRSILTQLKISVLFWLNWNRLWHFVVTLIWQFQRTSCIKFASHFKNITLINFPYFNIIIKKRYITYCEKRKII